MFTTLVTCSCNCILALLCAEIASATKAILGTNFKATTDVNFKNIFNDVPEVFLKESPTMSSTTVVCELQYQP